jgi:hypothetical protein
MQTPGVGPNTCSTAPPKGKHYDPNPARTTTPAPDATDQLIREQIAIFGIKPDRWSDLHLELRVSNKLSRQRRSNRLPRGVLNIEKLPSRIDLQEHVAALRRQP